MFQIVQDAIVPPAMAHAAAGGFVVFEGRVRDHNDGRSVLGITYEAFEEMAVSEGEGILAEAMERYPILEAHAVHRVGSLVIGDAAVWVGVAAPHRREAFEACEFIIDTIKHRLPVWKKERYVDGESVWVHCQHGAPSVTEEAYYARQLSLPQVGAGGQAALRGARVLVVGAGGLAASAIPYLASAGVGTLGLCEPDVLAASNLHRQVLYSAADVGSPKVDLAAAAVRRLNPFTIVRVHREMLAAGNAAGIAGGYDIVLDCTDNFRTRFLLNDTCLRLGKALVQASVYQFEGQVHVLDPASGSPCLRCLWPDAPLDGCVGTCAEVGVLGVTPGYFGILQATEAIKHILRAGDRLTQDVLVVDLLTHHAQRIRRVRDPRCPCCGSGAPSTAPALEIDPTADLSAYVPVDIREPAERTDRPALGPHVWLQIPGSVFRDHLPELDPAHTYLLVCARGVRSLRLASELAADGHTGFRSLAGGASALRLRGPEAR